MVRLVRQPNKIFFWERIAFRISAGFLLPVLVSAYALQYVSDFYTEVSEFEERTTRLWHGVHVHEQKSLLNLTKMRMNTQAMLVDPSPTLPALLLGGSKEFRIDLEYSRKTVERIAEENGVEVDAQVVRFYTYIFSLHKALELQVERFIDASKRESPEAGSIRKEVDRLAMEMEVSIGKLRATQEFFELNISELLQTKKETAKRVLIFFLAAVGFFGLCGAIFVTLSITGPLRQIGMRVKDIAMGNGDLTKRVYTRTGGEMRELASWMNLFLEKTQSIITTISSASEVVKRTTEQVGGHTDRTSLAAAGISKNMMEQSMNLDECTNSLSSIDDLIQSSGESTRQAASLSKIAMDRALQGGSSVHETIAAMEKIEESAKKIEELVSSINEIASQTNLLAINAAIEATKAGEHGKGFAVVAEEVRKLAERARKLTGEVTSLMGESSVRVKAGVSLAKGAGVSLDGIIKDVEAVSSLIQRIAASASKQTESSTLVLEFMQKVSDTVRTNLGQVQEVTKSAEQTSMDVEKLESLVSQLNEIVSQFRLDEITREIELPKVKELRMPPVPPPLPSVPAGDRDAA